MEVEGEIGGAGVVFAAGGGDGVERKREVLENALAHFKAAEGIFAGPVENAVKVAAFGEFEHNFGRVGGGARLAQFIAVEFWLFTGLDGLQQFFVDAALAAGAVTHQNGQAQDDGVLRVVLQHLALGHELGLAVKSGGGGHVGGAVRRVGPAVEDHVARHMNEAGPEVGGELGEQAGQGDVYLFGLIWIGIDGGGV